MMCSSNETRKVLRGEHGRAFTRISAERMRKLHRQRRSSSEAIRLYLALKKNPCADNWP